MTFPLAFILPFVEMRQLQGSEIRQAEVPMAEENEMQEVFPPAPAYNRWLLVAVLFFLATTVGSAIYLVDQRREARRLTAAYDQMSVARNQAQSQLEDMTAELRALSAPPATPEAQAAPQETAPQAVAKTTAKARHQRAGRAAEKRVPTEDPRWKQMQAELAEHQKQIDTTRQDIDRARVDMEGRLTSTRDELNQSIARNHEELVALEKRGEKNYFEFDLAKSKQFSRVGPLSLSLRKAHTKRQYCDLKLIVDDVEIEKKHVNLYEPFLLYPTDYSHPLEVVINHIAKSQARGYVSVPKYRQSQLAASAPAGAKESPASTSTASLEHRSPATPQ